MNSTALEKAIAAVNGELGFPGRILTGGQRGAAQGALMAARDIGLSTGGIAPKGWRVTLWDGTDGSDPWLAELGLMEHESADYRDRTMQNVADAEATLWIGEVGEKSQPMTLAVVDELGARCAVNPEPLILRDWCELHQIKVLHVAGECSGPDSPDIATRAYDLIGAAFGSGCGWCIRHRGDPLLRPYAGEQCAIVSVPPGKIYSDEDEDEAIADCFRLRQVGSGFEVGRIFR